MKRLAHALVALMVGLGGCMVLAPDEPGDSFDFPPGFRWRVHEVTRIWSTVFPEIRWEFDLEVWETYRRMRSPEVEEVWTRTSPLTVNRWWVTDTALIWVYSEGGGSPYPWATQIPPEYKGLRFRLGTREFSSLPEMLTFIARYMRDGLVFGPQTLAQPQKTLKFPLETGQRWVVFTDPWLRMREVVGVDTVTGPDGTLQLAWKIHTIDSSLNDILAFEDWVTDRLWLRKYLLTRSIVFDENGHFLGYMYIEMDDRLVKVIQ